MKAASQTALGMAGMGWAPWAGGEGATGKQLVQSREEHRLSRRIS